MMAQKKLIPKFYQDYWDKALDDTELFVKIYISPDSKTIFTPTPPQQDFIDRAQSGLYDELWMAGGNSCQPLDLTKVLMGDGNWKKLRDVEVGDEVYCPDEDGVGVVAPVTNKGLRGQRMVYKLSFSDGGYVYATCQHRFPSWRRVGDEDIFKKRRVDEFRTNVSAGRRDRLQRARIENPEKDYPIEPYFLGVLIGDGGLTKEVCVTTVEKEILELIKGKANKFNCYVKQMGDEITYRLSTNERSRDDRGCFINENQLKTVLEKLGLFGHKSTEKFIPQAYLQGSIEQRRELLAGLIDTDGSVASTNSVAYEYTTSSKQLAADFVYLAKSVGYHAKKKTRTVNGFISHRIYLSGNEPLPCRLLRKKRETPDYRPRNRNYRVLRDIEEVGVMPTAEITVDHPNHCYISDDWVVTGNSGKTWTGKFLATKFACYKIKPKKRWADYDDWYQADYDILCTAPEQKQAIELWEHIEQSFKSSPILRYKVAGITTGTRRATHPRITLKNGTRIDAVGLHDKGKHIEGQAYDLILINEPADVRHLIHSVEKVLIPRTWRRGGIIAGFGTPKGKNEYYNLWRRGQKELNGYENPYYEKRVYSCYVDSRDNPYADQSQIRKFLDTKNDDLIEERIKGRFSDMQMLAFPDKAIDEITDEDLSTKIGRSSFRRYLHGVDFGRKEDYTVSVTFDITDIPYTMVNFYRKGGGVATWEEIFSDLLDIYQEYGGDFVCDASASAGDMQMEWLSDMNIPYYPFQFGGSPAKKVGLINNLQRYITEGKIRFPPHQQLLEELHSYPRDMKDKGLMTDCVMALALACHGIENYRISGHPEPMFR
jgi:intein/homing endonuclease